MFESIWNEITLCAADPAGCAERVLPYWGHIGAGIVALLGLWLLARMRRRRREEAARQLETERLHRHQDLMREDRNETSALDRLDGRDLPAVDLDRSEYAADAAPSPAVGGPAPPLPPPQSGIGEPRHQALAALHMEIDLIVNRLARAAEGIGRLAELPAERLLENMRVVVPEWIIDLRAAYLTGIEQIATIDAQVPGTIGAFYDMIGIWNARLRNFASGAHRLDGAMLKRLVQTNQRIRAVGESARILIERYIAERGLPALPQWVEIRFTEAEHGRIRKRSGGLDLGDNQNT